MTAPKPHLLLIDDDPNTLASLSRAFRLAGYEATVCDSAIRALELLRMERFDIIFSDVVMPGKDGISLLEDLKAAGTNTPVVMISGQASIEIAVGDNGPELSDIQTLDPLGNAFYETHCFSPDDRSILFSTTKEPGDFRHMNIVRMNLATGHTEMLTDPALEQWNEHAQFSPDGSRIVWISSMGIDQDLSKANKGVVKTDYWMMNADGSNKHRLTYFNEPGAPEYRPSENIASDLSWSPDGKAIVVYVQMRRKGDKIDDFPGSILRITLP